MLPACLGTPGCVSSTCGRASDCPYTALTNCSGNPGSFGVCAASGEGRGPGGCPPGITQPTAVPTVGAGAWQCARKLGSHDERLGGESVKSLKSSMDTSSYRLQRLPRHGGQGWCAGVGGGHSLLGLARAHPFPGSPQILQANIPFYPGTNPFSPEWPPSGFLPRPHCLLAHYHFMVAQLSVCLPRSLSRRVSAPQGRNLTLFPAVSPCWEQCLAHSGCFSGQARPALLFSSLKNLSVPPSAAVSGHSAGTILDLCLSPSLRPRNVTC